MEARDTGAQQHAAGPAGLPAPESIELHSMSSSTPSLARLETVNSAIPSHYGPLRQKFIRSWRRYVSLAVPQVRCRDHLGEYNDNHTFDVYQPPED
jgi:hypothetical protein